MYKNLLSFALTKLAPGGYNYNSFGDDWSTDFPQCGGVNQSPIDITVSKRPRSSKSFPFQFKMSNKSLRISYLNTGDSIKTSGNFCSVKTIDSNNIKAKYDSIQFHVHAPAEHTLNGKLGDAEVHFVHKLATESTGKYQYVVVGVIFKVTNNAESEFFKKWNIDLTPNASGLLNLKDALLQSVLQGNGFYTYFGSFTNPPCTETVRFFILDKMIDVSENQMAILNNLWKSNPTFAGGNGNNRRTQPLNGRVVNYVKLNNGASIGVFKESDDKKPKRTQTQTFGSLEGCLTYESSTVCSVCDTSNKYYLVADKCVKYASETCDEIDQNGRCINCKQGFYLADGNVCRAVDVIAGCVEYSTSASSTVCIKRGGNSLLGAEQTKSTSGISLFFLSQVLMAMSLLWLI